MRVHPDVLKPKPRWPLFVVSLLLMTTILASGMLSFSSNRAVATQSNRITKLEVVIAKAHLLPGAVISAADIGLEVRPIESVPEGVFLKREDVIGKTLGVEVRHGTPLARLSLASNPLPQPELEHEALPVAGPAAAEVIGDTPLRQADVQPQQEQSVEDTVKSVLGPEMPAASKSVAPAAIAKKQERVQPQPRDGERRTYRSYAWVTGGKVTYGVDSSGEIEVIDRNGRSSRLRD
jgi:hypothetical protein